MRKEEFRAWLIKKGTGKKVQSDIISRVKRVEREIGYGDLDKQYLKDHCQSMLNALKNMGINESMKKFPNVNLPIGKYYMATYSYSLSEYIAFCNDATPINEK